MPNVYFRFNRQPPQEIVATSQLPLSDQKRLPVVATGVTCLKIKVDGQGLPRAALLDELPFLIEFKFDGVEVTPDEYGYDKAELLA